MIKTLLADKEPQIIEALANSLSHYCPRVDVRGMAHSEKEACRLIQNINPDLVFIEIEMALDARALVFEKAHRKIEAIILHSNENLYMEAPDFQISGYLTKPIQIKELVMIVQQALHWIKLKKEQFDCRKILHQLLYQSPPNDVIGIPAMGGMEFLKVEEIIRCEGLQQFTRVVTIEGASIISSYNIGKFCKLLFNYGFFSPHKSHLVNLQHLRRYHSEGTIIMRDGSSVPVSRRRKSLFLQRVSHL